MLTRFSLHSCRNCRNFLVVRRFALPIAERILPCTVNVNAITTVHFARNSHCMHQLKHQHLAVQLATVTRSTVLKLRLDCMLLLRHFAKKTCQFFGKVVTQWHRTRGHRFNNRQSDELKLKLNACCLTFLGYSAVRLHQMALCSTTKLL